MLGMSSRPARILLVATTLALAPAIAHAAPSRQDRAHARTLAAEARKASKAGSYDEAASKLEQAVQLDPVAQYRLDLARAYAGEGKLVEAKGALDQLFDESATPHANRFVVQAGKKLAAELEPKIPTIAVAITGPDESSAHIQIDGKDVAAGAEVPFDPGEHVVGADADGFEHAERKVTLTEGQHEKVSLTLAKTPPPPVAEKPPSKVPAYVALGVGAVGVGLGTAFGIMAFHDKSKAEESCSGNVCKPAAQSAIDSSLTKGNVSTVAFVVGGVGLAAGAYLWFRASKKPAAPTEADHAHVEPILGPLGGGLRGTF